MNRRTFLGALTLGALAMPPSAGWAQQVKRIGFLRVGPPPQQFIAGFRQGLREQGLTEGQNVVIEWGLAGSVAQLPDALAGLMRLNVDVLVASGTSSVLLTRNAARTIPVVFVAAVDPVAMGLVKTLARPGGTVNRHHRRGRGTQWKATGIAAAAHSQSFQCRFPGACGQSGDTGTHEGGGACRKNLGSPPASRCCARPQRARKGNFCCARREGATRRG